MCPLDILGGLSIPHTLHVISTDNDDFAGEVRESGSIGVVVMLRNICKW